MGHQTFEDWLEEENDELWKEYYKQKYGLDGLPDPCMDFFTWAHEYWIKGGTFGGGS